MDLLVIIAVFAVLLYARFISTTVGKMTPANFFDKILLLIIGTVFLPITLVIQIFEVTLN